MNELGKLLVHGIPMRPAAPTGFGLIGDKKVFFTDNDILYLFVGHANILKRALYIYSNSNYEVALFTLTHFLFYICFKSI